LSSSLRDLIASRFGNKLIQQLLQELLRNPGRAHRSWRQLGEGQRQFVAQTCGDPFAKGMDAPVSRAPVLRYTQPGMGRSPDQLRAQGYCFIGQEPTGAYDVEDWVHPSGDLLRRDVSDRPMRVEPAGRDSADRGEENEDGVKIETFPDQPNVTALAFPDDPWKLLRAAESANERLAAYCDANPLEVFEDYQDASEYQDEVGKYIDTAKLAQTIVEGALSKLDEIRKGPNTLPQSFWHRVDAVKAANALLGPKCCANEIKGASFGCSADPSGGAPTP
jgi:hypothetical protein